MYELDKLSHDDNHKEWCKGAFESKLKNLSYGDLELYEFYTW